MLTLAACVAGYEPMKPSFKRLIVFIFLLVLVSLAAHMLVDTQHADNGLQAKWDVCILHTAVLLQVISMALVVPAIAQIPHQTTSALLSLNPIPFHPPIF
ncbi:MAG: hypothetical protein ABIU06_15615 [Anaerolineales bacterium]